MKPEAGQWWCMKDEPSVMVWSVGLSACGNWVIEWSDGTTSMSCPDDFYHEPRCTGWDWVVPEHPISLADYLAITADWTETNRRRAELIHKKVARTISAEERTELNHLQSLATSRANLVAPLPLEELERLQPAEDPDEWVILDSVKYANHVPRIGVDEFSTGNGRWQTQKEHHGNGTVAYWKAHEDLIHRCRRRDLPKAEQARTESESDHVPDATKKISDESLELIVHLRDQMQVLANRVAECERVVFAQTPQPQKKPIRLWIDPDCNIHAGLKGDCDLELHYDHETRQFYTEEPS